MSDIDFPLVKLKAGLIKGKSKRNFYSFQGIPYGTPPLHNLRFARSLPVEPWKGTVDAAREFHKVAPQLDVSGTAFHPQSDEDCLRLHVYTTSLHPERLLPVMVYFHGGSFAFRSGNANEFGPEPLMAKGNVVLVMVNYRLGPLGFLVQDELNARGNQAMWDQNLALKWVQENIGSFGGNRDNVTIFGESAGSYSVFYHLFSPKSRGLFHKVVGQSGTPFSPSWKPLSLDRARDYGKQITTAFDQDLRHVKVEELLRVHVQHQGRPAVNPFNVVNDSELCDDPFFTDDPEVDPKVSVVIGVTKDECGFHALGFNDPEKFVGKMKEYEQHGSEIIFDEPSAAGNELVLEALAAYSLPDDPCENAIRRYIQFRTDVTFNAGVERMTRMLVQNGNAVYRYRFSYLGEHSYMDMFGGDPPPRGVCHGEELFFLFAPAFQVDTSDLSKEDEKIRQRMIRRWTKFAADGDPGWERVTEERYQFLEIDDEDDMVYPRDFMEKMAMWENWICRFEECAPNGRNFLFQK